MAKTSADMLIDTLRNWGANTVFGLPGDGIKKSLRAQEQQAPERAPDARSK
jgi:pyruvate dehydrogenase (quinone)/pyruvate oxidase